jgi:hypothetical protein
VTIVYVTRFFFPTMPLVNVYIRRVAKTEGSCDVCYKPTTIVLFSSASQPTDWFYVCDKHLTDTGFCQQDPPPAPTPPPAPAPPVKTTAAAKTTTEAEATPTTTETDAADNTTAMTTTTTTTTDETDQATTKSPPPPVKYILHRDIFYLRKARLAEKQRIAAVQQILNQMPAVPKTLGQPSTHSS